MRSVKYLNGVLSVIAVLLSLNLWTAWTASPSGGVMSLANHSRAAQAQAQANAAVKQQKKILDELEKIQKNTDNIDDMLDYGKATVKIKSAD